MAEDTGPRAPSAEAQTDAAERVLEAVGYRSVLDSPQRAVLVSELASHLRAFGTQLKSPAMVTQAEADAIEKAQARLRQLVEDLQHRENPPPRLTPHPSARNDKSTALDLWLTPYRFPGLPGRRSVYDWRWIARLLAFYEVAFGREAKASPKGANQLKPPPTLRFLNAALGAAGANGFEPADGEGFSSNTLRAFLQNGGRKELAKSKRELEKLVGPDTGAPKVH